MLKKLIKLLLPISWLLLVFYSIWIFFDNRGGFDFASGLEFSDWAGLMFPLFGLIAFNMLWMQFILGSSRELWQKLYPGVIRYHMTHGIFVFLFTMMHPLLVIVAFGIEKYFFRTFLPENLRFIALLGQLAFYLMCLTVATALLRRVKFLQFLWRKIHILNYAVFTLAWFHSWNIGSDIQSTNLRYVWIFYGLTALISAAGKLYRKYFRKNQAASSSIP